jgi:hypothetical protein
MNKINTKYSVTVLCRVCSDADNAVNEGQDHGVSSARRYFCTQSLGICSLKSKFPDS